MPPSYCSATLLYALLIIPYSSSLQPQMARRNWFQQALFSLVTASFPNSAVADNHGNAGDNDYFASAGFARQEYTNSIIASRNTNISPKEVYDTLERLQKQSVENTTNRRRRALDVGAGAGVSTQVLWNMGYHEIDALDWSNEAWQANVVEGGQCPPEVHFYQLDDERFLNMWHDKQLAKYDVISFNFAINRDKAMKFLELLQEPGGLLLAPVNVQKDYWLKQDYQLYGQDGKLLWSASDVGAWSVQFQPDVTSETCQGIWCPQFNGFQRLR